MPRGSSTRVAPPPSHARAIRLVSSVAVSWYSTAEPLKGLSTPHRIAWASACLPMPGHAKAIQHPPPWRQRRMYTAQLREDPEYAATASSDKDVARPVVWRDRFTIAVIATGSAVKNRPASLCQIIIGPSQFTNVNFDKYLESGAFRTLCLSGGFIKQGLGFHWNKFFLGKLREDSRWSAVSGKKFRRS